MINFQNSPAIKVTGTIFQPNFYHFVLAIKFHKSNENHKMMRKSFSLLLFLGFLSPAWAQQADCRVIVNADQGRHTISRHIYGHFAEHLGRCVYDGFTSAKTMKRYPTREACAMTWCEPSGS
jgi:hypothetical protein